MRATTGTFITPALPRLVRPLSMYHPLCRQARWASKARKRRTRTLYVRDPPCDSWGDFSAPDRSCTCVNPAWRRVYCMDTSRIH